MPTGLGMAPSVQSPGSQELGLWPGGYAGPTFPWVRVHTNPEKDAFDGISRKWEASPAPGILRF